MPYSERECVGSGKSYPSGRTDSQTQTLSLSKRKGEDEYRVPPFLGSWGLEGSAPVVRTTVKG